MTMLRNCLIVITICGIALGHVRLRNPAGRSSIWRDPQFAHLNPLVNEKDDDIRCGGLPYLQPDPVDNCGVCGDLATEEVPRSNENGGKYGRGIITGVYRAGQVAMNLKILRKKKHFRKTSRIGNQY